MNCEQMTLLMSAWLDGELSEMEERQMKEHLEQCPECRELMEQLQALHTSFSDLEEIPAPEGFADSVMERIARESKPKVIPLFKRPQIRALGALAACAALFVGFGSIRMGGSAKSEAAAPMAPPLCPSLPCIMRRPRPKVLKSTLQDTPRAWTSPWRTQPPWNLRQHPLPWMSLKHLRPWNPPPVSLFRSRSVE